MYFLPHRAEILTNLHSLNHNRIDIGRGYSGDHAVKDHVHPLSAHVVGQGVSQGRRSALKANLSRVQRLPSPVAGISAATTNAHP